MKNYNKTVLIFGVLYFAALLVFMILTGGGKGVLPGRDTNIIILNDISKDAGDNWGDLNRLGETDYGVDYAVLDTEGNLLFSPNPKAVSGLSITKALKNGGLYSYVTVGDKMTGYVILKDDVNGAWHGIRLKLIIGLGIFGVLLIMSAVLFGKYIDKSIITPFNNMKDFAGSIAEGKLDAPLEMDRNNMFGAFTESFDIMREELSASRKREIELQRRERELVASLSHDIKTPITGIKVTTELLKAQMERSATGTVLLARENNAPKEPSPWLTEKLDNIYKKADQIDVLVSDLFSATLEDLDELKVSCTDESSEVIRDIIQKYDDRELVTLTDIPKVLIRVDVKRLSQVIGNIISNSYKYAGTGIKVNCRQVDDYLQLNIKDSGPGVPDDELDLITNKFYRGKQWAGSKEEGSGLGLYIAKTLMEKMDGELLASNDEGLTVTLMIPLS
ncbi:MAG: HAMP domain-containing histidine kinase [Lachnospiraceae bacterium]|nr:HAMP domain-containing histidine kinase [Lachnospiraceae bacterium]